MYKIFIVEDDPIICRYVIKSLEKWGFECTAAEDFRNVAALIESCAPHLVLMDITLPYYNGYYWVEQLRRTSSIPVIYLSSRSESADIVLGMNMGGDDYITKPFSTDVLLAKINAMLRRVYSYSESKSLLSCAQVFLDPSAACLSFDDRKIDLTRNELKILTLLMEKKNSVVSREALIKALWDDDSFIDDNTLTVNINRLRTKLEEYGISSFITTKKGLGYAVYDSELL